MMIRDKIKEIGENIDKFKMRESEFFYDFFLIEEDKIVRFCLIKKLEDLKYCTFWIEKLSKYPFNRKSLSIQIDLEKEEVRYLIEKVKKFLIEYQNNIQKEKDKRKKEILGMQNQLLNSINFN